MVESEWLKGSVVRREEGWTGISERRLEVRRETGWWGGESENNRFTDLDELLGWLDVAGKM